jgi:predicted phage baseplate assembly protein
VMAQEPGEALPVVQLTDESDIWSVQRDLLSSDRFASDFVVEMEEGGRAHLRFGDDVLGRKPATGTTLKAIYRVGNGGAGNVGAGAIAHIVPSGIGTDQIMRVWNPLPAQGGTDAEGIEQVRLYAPQAFRIQERAVTEADYAEVVQRHPEVQKAVATLRWTGSWYTMFITVDRRGGREVDDQFKKELRGFIERFRMACHDIEIDAPRFVPLDIAFTVCVAPGYLCSDVKPALLEIFSNIDLPDGQRGFFHPDNYTFEQPVYLSQIVAAAMQVPGVLWIDTSEKPTHRFKRWGQPSRKELEEGMITFDRLEIARLNNDPNFPENGKIEFFMKGGL